MLNSTAIKIPKERTRGCHKTVPHTKRSIKKQPITHRLAARCLRRLLAQIGALSRELRHRGVVPILEGGGELGLEFLAFLALQNVLTRTYCTTSTYP